LRHISRTRLLVYVLDISETPVETLRSLQHELAEYDPALLERPALVALNKTDLASPEEVETEVAALTPFGLPVVAVSAATGENLDLLRDTLFALLPERPRLEPLAKGERRVTTEPVRVKRHRSGQGWVVTGPELEALVNRFDPTNREAVAYLQHFFAELGVSRLLKEAGAASGDDIYIADAVFEYFDESREAEEAEGEEDA
jgi:GTP-binding protein